MEMVFTGICAQWSVANFLTTFRALSILLALPLVYFERDVYLFVLVILAVASDAEGYLARWTNTTTNIGRVGDPIADKLFSNTMLLMYFSTHGSFILMSLLVCNFGYDIDNTTRRFREIIDACLNKKATQDKTPATLLSKSKTCVLYVLLIGMYTPQAWLVGVWVPINFFVGVSIFLVLISWWNNRKNEIFVLLHNWGQRR